MGTGGFSVATCARSDFGDDGILRTIGRGMVRNVRGLASAWDPARRVPGSHAAFLEFEGGAIATAIFNGYDHYDSRELVFGPGSVDASRHASARRELAASSGAGWEADAAREERYGGERSSQAPTRGSGPGGGWIMGGPLITSFDDADVTFSAKGLEVFDNEKRWEIDLTSPEDGRDGRLNTYHDAIVDGARLPADGEWGLATLEVLLAVERSGETHADVVLEHQTPSVD
jgi:phthalate 4,5-cis-dihydrodiol dehydrogenase